MNVAAIIERKRDGGVLTPDEIQELVTSFTEGTLPDYQMSALAMAIYFQGLNDEERAALTHAMMTSGEVVDLSSVPGPKVDKHSTGGVGDKVSLCLAPLVAARGVRVPMISGRGLGHTGGTLDKLESIPGFSVKLPVSRFVELVDDIGLCLIGQTETLVPADRKLYALRDVTGTVHSKDLICSSIMSKKLAEGIDGLVLDVKVGSGAFMKTIDDARALARMMISIGARLGKTVHALLTDMSQPLGEMVGNAVEAIEAIEVLHGRGPRDLVEITLELGAEMLLVGGVAKGHDEARAMVRAAIDDGSGLDKMRAMVQAQGGDPACVDQPDGIPVAPGREVVTATMDGYLAEVDAAQVGWASIELGAGRKRKEDEIDPGVGIQVHVRIGDRVERGQPIATIIHRDGRGVEQARKMLLEAFQLRDEPGTEPRLIMDRVE